MMVLHAPALSPPVHHTNDQATLINIDPLSPQIRPRHINLLHKLRMRLGHIVECQDAVSEFEQQVCAEGNEGPEWKLIPRKSY